MHEELRRLAARLQLAREQERSVIAHRLHDDIAQALTAVKMDLDACHRKLPEDVQPAVDPLLSSITAMLDDAIKRVRSLFDDLVPAMLEDLGLVPTIEWEGDEFARRTGIPCTVECPKRLKRVDRRTALLLYRVVQQALAHVAQPFLGESVRIVLSQENANTMLRFSANGHIEVPQGMDSSPALVGDLYHEIVNRGGTLQAYRSLDGEMVMQVTVPSVGLR
jgi:signal transduction histidine kinase